MYRKLTLTMMVLAVVLRLLLCWANPPENSYDNHFRPISLMLETGHIPPKDACFECYNPPVFYGVSAIVADGLFRIGVSEGGVTKSLQFLNCFYCILTLPLVYLILKRLPLSELSRLLALGVICFLPVHLHVSAMHSNDGLTYLAVALCVYQLLVCIDRKLAWRPVILLAVALSVTIFIKYTAFVVLPMAAVPLAALVAFGSAIPRKRAAAALAVTLLPPLLLLGTYMEVNLKNTGHLLPWNDSMIDTAKMQPHDPGGVSLTTFEPWLFIKNPIIIPGQMQSFWTLVYTGAWFDDEPKFTNFTDRDNDWWSQYCNWLGGKAPFPQKALPLSAYTRTLAGGLLTLGLVPFFLLLLGLCVALKRALATHREGILENVKLLAFPTLLLFNTAGIVMLALKAPVFSSMKTSYFLNSLAAFAVFVAFGCHAIEKRRNALVPVCSIIVILAALASLHVLEIVWALEVI